MGESRTIAFRAEMPRQPHNLLYWRGALFSRMEGNRWMRDQAQPLELLRYKGAHITQSIYLEPGLSHALFCLDAPVTVSLPRARGITGGVFEYPGAISRRLCYRADSVASGVLATTAAVDRAYYLMLPSRIPQRIQRLANDIRGQGRGDEQKLARLEQFFLTGNFRYSMRDLPVGDDALEQFLFTKKQGHCEFFASAFALLLRASGVPARLVGGYLGGEYNELGGYYLVSDNLAHVWVEAYLDGRGWIRVDPSGFALNANEMWGKEQARNPMSNLRLFLDSLDHLWNRSIVTYDFEQQAQFAISAGKRLQQLKTGAVTSPALTWLLMTPALALFLMVVVRRSMTPAAINERLLKRFYRLAERDCGIVIGATRPGLHEVARRAKNDAVTEFTAIYGGALYRDRQLTRREYARLRRILKTGFVTKK